MLKWSLDSSRLTRGCARIADRNRAATSPSSSRSRFFEKAEWSHTGSSTPRPTNQRNRRSYSVRSISCRSERTEQKAWSSIARGSIPGAIEGPPMPEHSAVNSPDSVSSASLTTNRIAHNGWSARTRCSRST